MSLLKGLVTKSYCGYFLVYYQTQFYRCRTRGKLTGQGVATGDFVDFLPQDAESGTIERIHPRKFFLKKPPVANINQVLLVFSATDPALDLSSIDRLLINIMQQNVRIALCINKIDLAGPDFEPVKAQLAAYTNIDIPVIYLSAAKSQGITELFAVIHERISVLVGPSGTGKTSLLNLLKVDLNLKTGQISDKIKRGKHTTRFVELVAVDENTWIVDSPGFSFVEQKLHPNGLQVFYSEFATYRQDCRFSDCQHIDEPDCGVKLAVENGAIARFRYDNYKNIMNVLRDQERNKYR